MKVFDFRDPDRDQQGAPISGFGVLTGRLFGRLNVIRRIRLPVFPLRIELVHRHQNLQGRLPPDPLRGFKVHRQAHRAFVTLVDRLGAPALQNPYELPGGEGPFVGEVDLRNGKQRPVLDVEGPHLREGGELGFNERFQHVRRGIGREADVGGEIDGLRAALDQLPVAGFEARRRDVHVRDVEAVRTADQFDPERHGGVFERLQRNAPAPGRGVLIGDPELSEPEDALEDGELARIAVGFDGGHKVRDARPFQRLHDPGFERVRDRRHDDRRRALPVGELRKLRPGPRPEGEDRVDVLHLPDGREHLIAVRLIPPGRIEAVLREETDGPRGGFRAARCR